MDQGSAAPTSGKVDAFEYRLIGPATQRAIAHLGELATGWYSRREIIDRLVAHSRRGRSWLTVVLQRISRDGGLPVLYEKHGRYNAVVYVDVDRLAATWPEVPWLRPSLPGRAFWLGVRRLWDDVGTGEQGPAA